MADEVIETHGTATPEFVAEMERAYDLYRERHPRLPGDGRHHWFTVEGGSLAWHDALTSELPEDVRAVYVLNNRAR